MLEAAGVLWQMWWFGGFAQEKFTGYIFCKSVWYGKLHWITRLIFVLPPFTLWLGLASVSRRSWHRACTDNGWCPAMHTCWAMASQTGSPLHNSVWQCCHTARDCCRQTRWIRNRQRRENLSSWIMLRLDQLIQLRNSLQEEILKTGKSQHC